MSRRAGKPNLGSGKGVRMVWALYLESKVVLTEVKKEDRIKQSFEFF